MTVDPQLLAARARVAAAKAQLDTSVAEAKVRLEPRALARETVSGVRDRSQAAAKAGLATAREQPAVVAVAAALIGVILARKPIKRSLRPLFRGKGDATAAEPRELKPRTRAKAPTKE
ncbi:hypothetical protein [Sphingomonas sp. RS2018]